MSLVQSLSELERELTLWCMGGEPTDERDLAHFTEVLAVRARVSQMLHLLELNRATWAGRELAEASRVIDATTRVIDSTAREARYARKIVDSVADAINVAARATAVGLGL